MAPKRARDRGSESNGKRKWLKTAPSSAQQSHLKMPPGTIMFRLLCPANMSGSLIGKGGGVVARIRQETGARIKIEEAVPGCDERVVVITSSIKVAEVENPQHNNDNNQLPNNSETVDGGENLKDSGENAEGKKDYSSEPLQQEKLLPSAQRALLLIFERIAESESENGDRDEASNDSSTVTIRMLVESKQVGCLLGEGGDVMKQMSLESGTQICILPKDVLPLCASGFDELVQISGQLSEAKKALQSVSQQLLDNLPHDNESFSITKPSVLSPKPFNSFMHSEVPHPEMLPPGNIHFPLPHPSRFHEADFLAPFPRFQESPALGHLQISPDPLTFKFICVNDKVGGLIGKGGSIIKMLQYQTACDIKVMETSPESDDRVIVITGPALPDDRISLPQDAALHVLGKIASSAPDVKENAVTIRVLVSSNQTGCLLGKGGSIITEMRRSTGAHIRILGKDQVPKYVSENDEVVQITGELEKVHEALLQITSRLKHHLFRDRFPPLNNSARPAFIDQAPPFRPYMGRREPSPPSLFSNLGPSFGRFDSVGGFQLHDERPFVHGLPPSIGDRLPWRAPGIGSGAGLMPIHDYTGCAPERRMGGFPGGSQQAVITNTTVDVVVPGSVVPSIYGDDGSSLRQIHQISGANITINEPRPGDTETVITISGAPDQTHAAQSLIQAFVFSESDSP